MRCCSYLGVLLMELAGGFGRRSEVVMGYEGSRWRRMRVEIVGRGWDG